MNDYEAKVQAFHAATETPVGAGFTVALLQLRKKLLREELAELEAEIDAGIAEIEASGAVSRETRVKLVKELVDVQYVLSGMAVTFGLPMEKAFDRVHESNLSKLGDDGRAIFRDDGKVMKGPNYKPAVLDDIV